MPRVLAQSPERLDPSSPSSFRRVGPMVDPLGHIPISSPRARRGFGAGLRQCMESLGDGLRRISGELPK
jgi:hypothetical protein